MEVRGALDLVNMIWPTLTPQSETFLKQFGIVPVTLRVIYGHFCAVSPQALTTK